tara:strand:- start:289 stop:471 length:183 start_codon:yes stop_codon:yes gene_type:complete
MYHKSRYRARKKYYEKEENKEKKRIYMREYAKRKKIKIELKSNENLNIINSEGFVDGAQG